MGLLEVCCLVASGTIRRTKDILSVLLFWRVTACAKGSQAFERQLRELEAYLGTGTTSKLGAQNPCEFPPKD